MWSGKLKLEFAGLSLEEVYLELVGKLYRIFKPSLAARCHFATHLSLSETKHF
jgi:hypothetical protein